MSTNVQIHNLRLSLIWVQVDPSLLQGVDLADAPFAFLTCRQDYKEKFTELRTLSSEKYSLSLPWPKSVGQRFWNFYFEGKKLDAITGNTAWKSLLPFRKKKKFIFQEVPYSAGSYLVESYFYPFGIALIITVKFRNKFQLDEAVDALFKIKRSKNLGIEQENNNSEYSSLEKIADHYLKETWKEAFGQTFSYAFRPTIPFTIVTIIQGSGVDPQTQMTEGDETHRTLEAITTWQPTWKYDNLPKIEEVSLHIRRSPPSHILYGRKRGRAVWFPGLFTQTSGKNRSLGCYHRNLVFTSLQVESLCRLIYLTADNLKNGVSVDGSYRDCARRAAGILGRLYGGVNTYRSWSSRAQIEQNEIVDDLNAVRIHFNLDPLQN